MILAHGILPICPLEIASFLPMVPDMVAAIVLLARARLRTITAIETQP